MNKVKNIVKIIVENVSLQDSLKKMIRDSGIVTATKAVGGINNVTKILDIDFENKDDVEMLVKNYIYFWNDSDVEISFLETRTSKNGNRIINIHFNSDSNASNIESWLARTLSDEMNQFFPFRIGVTWEPFFASRNVKIFIDATKLN